MFEAKAEAKAKILASRWLRPRGFNISGKALIHIMQNGRGFSKVITSQKAFLWPQRLLAKEQK